MPFKTGPLHNGGQRYKTQCASVSLAGGGTAHMGAEGTHWWRNGNILHVSGCVRDPTVAPSVPGAKRHLLLCSWVAHAGTGWLMWLPWVGDSACNQAPACNHLLLLFICNFTEGQSCCQSLRAPVSGRGRRKAGVCMKGGGRTGRVPCHKHPPRFPPPMPGTIRLWQVPQGQTVNFNKLWVTVSDKSTPPLLSPSKQGGIFPRTLCFQGHTMTHVCVDKTSALLWLISLRCGFAHGGIRRDTFLSEPGFAAVSPSRLIGQRTHFSRSCPPPADIRGPLVFVLHTHPFR